jgi:CelD/BcsL family acetyltransferase involved in cellulose biosynthesis
MVHVVEINDIEQLSQYRMLWNSMFAATPNATFFQTIDWLEANWRHFGADQKLRVLIPYSAGQPLGILPLCVRREKHRLSTVRVLTYPLDNWGSKYGPIGPNPAATMMAAMQHLRRTPRDWDMLELRWVPAEDTEGGKTARALRMAGMFSNKAEYQWTSILDLPSDWKTFTAAKSRSLRSQFKRQLRAFEDDAVEYIRHRPAPASEGDGDPRWDLYEMCEEIAAASWQGAVSNGNTLTHGRVRNFYRDAHAVAARLGMVDVNVIRYHGRPAAFLYNYICDGRIYSLRMGYDPAFTEQGFGSSLILKTVQDSISRGDRELDFGPGEREHKRRLRTGTESTYRLTYTPVGSWRSQAVRFTRWAKDHWPQPAASAVNTVAGVATNIN